MKVLQVNSVYNTGSTGKITYDIHQELLAENIESVVCYGRGKYINEPNIYKTCGELYSKINHFFANLTGVMYGGCYFSTKKLEKIIALEKPDIVHLQCINGYFVNIYKIIEWLKKNNIKTVITLHAEFMYTANCGHALECNQWKTGCVKCPRVKKETKTYFLDRTSYSWKRMKKAFDKFENNLIVISVSPWLKSRANESEILKGKDHRVILNGLDTGIFHYYAEKDLEELYDMQHERTLLFVTPFFSKDINHIKGGYFIIQLAKLLINQNIKIIVAGDYEKNIEVPKNVVLLGKISNQTELAKLYAASDLTVMTSKRETFSMVVAESLCCGTPVVGFEAGAPEQIALKEYSKFVEFGNVQSLYDIVMQMIDKDFDKKQIAKDSKQKYDRKLMCEEYLKIYREMWEKKNDLL